MALDDLGPKVRGSMVVSFAVVDNFDEEPFLIVIFDCVEISEQINYGSGVISQISTAPPIYIYI
jgi:hypothetical protein